MKMSAHNLLELRGTKRINLVIYNSRKSKNFGRICLLFFVMPGFVIVAIFERESVCSGMGFV